MIDQYIQILKDHALFQPDPESILTLLYDAYCETHRMDDEQVKDAFNRLYELMNGMSLREMDHILDPVCSLCRAHERSGFIEGIKVGLQLGQEQHAL